MIYALWLASKPFEIQGIPMADFSFSAIHPSCPPYYHKRDPFWCLRFQLTSRLVANPTIRAPQSESFKTCETFGLFLKNYTENYQSVPYDDSLWLLLGLQLPCGVIHMP